MKNVNFALLIILFISLSFNSCKDKIIIQPYDKYVSDNFRDYKDIRETLVDTLIQWKVDSLIGTTNFFYQDTWQIDSILLFNRDSSRLFTTLNVRHGNKKDSRSDIIEGIVGVKIKKKWYFHFGGTRIVSRLGLKSDIYSTLSFEELSFISHTRTMARFLKINENGEYFIDYDEMENYFYKAYRSYYPNLDKIDSLILTRIAAYKRKKLDDKYIKKVKESGLNSVRPEDPETKSKSWWDETFGKEEVGLFETEAWKNRRKN